jgi:hypothetical protein
MDSSISSKSVWWTHSVLYITCMYLTGVRVCTSIILPFTRYFLHVNFHELACMNSKIWNIFKHIKTQKHAMSTLFYHFMTMKCLVYLYMSFMHSSSYTWNTTALFLCLILQKKSLEDGILLFYQPHIHICCQRILLFLRNMFKFLGYTQFLEIRTTSKEIMLFHDNGFVLLRFARGYN